MDYKMIQNLLHPDGLILALTSNDVDIDLDFEACPITERCPPFTYKDVSVSVEVYDG